MANLGPDGGIEVGSTDLAELCKLAWAPIASFLHTRHNRRLAADVLRAVKGIQHPGLLRYLGWRYPNEPMLVRCGEVYPVAVYPASPRQQVNVDSALGPLLPSDAKADLIADSSYRNTVTSLDLLTLPPDRNLLTYAMDRLDLHEGVRLSCSHGRYFDSLDSCEALEWELRRAVHDMRVDASTESEFQDFEGRCLPLRSGLHKAVLAPTRDGTGRCAAVGISTTIAFNNGKNGYELLMRRRARRGQPLRAGCLHVVPSFMFQAMTTDAHLEYVVSHNIFREYLEEVFSNKMPDADGDYRYFYKDPRLLYLISLLERGSARLLLTGVGVNLMNLRPDICALLVIHDPEWYDRCAHDQSHCWRFNDEFMKSGDDDMAPHLCRCRVRLLEDDAEMIRQNFLVAPLTVPAGAAAFWLGVDALRQQIAARPA